MIVTKLDGSARGGVVVALAEEFGLPIHAVAGEAMILMCLMLKILGVRSQV